MKVVVAGPIAQFSDFLRRTVKGEISWCFCEHSDEAELCELLINADVYVGYHFTPAMAEAARSVQLIQVSGAGVDKIAFDALHPGVIVANTYRHERSIAEYVLMAMLALSRQLILSDIHLRQGIWDHIRFNSAIELHNTLRGRTVGLIGFGHIGTEVARLASCFEMRVVAIKRTVDPSLVARHKLHFIGGPGDLAQVIRRSDFVVLAATLSAKTRGMVGRDELALMKPTSYLINIARAELVNEAALYTALLERRIAGAALDVWYSYPTADTPALPASYPFHQLDNVILTPHCSGHTNETFVRRAQDVATNIERQMTGQPLANVVYIAQESSGCRGGKAK